MPQYGYLAHHGVKGMKWGVRKQRPVGTGYHHGQSPTKPSPNKRKAITGAVLGTLGAAALVGGGVALAKNPGAVKSAVGAVGKAFAKSPKTVIENAHSIKGALTRNVKSAKGSAKVFKQAFKAERKAARQKFMKEAPGRAKNAVKSIAKNTAGGVLDGLKGAAKEASSRENIANIVKEGVTGGIKVAAVAAISGGIGLGVKAAVSGKKPTRDEVTKYITKNPNKKKG